MISSRRIQCHAHAPRFLDIQNLPHVVLRELLPMLDTSSKMTLRLVSQTLRDLIDTQRNFRFNVELSDDTSSIFLRFNHFDFYYFPRVLHHLKVTTLLSPLKVFSTSISRCPLPPQIHTLEFSETRGISQENFLKLLKFYGQPNYMKKLSMNMMAVEKVEEVKAVKQGLKLNFLEELELTFPDTFGEIRFPRLLLGGVFQSLHTLSVNFRQFGGYHPILYKDFFLFLGRNLTSLRNVDVIHPFNYLDTELQKLARSRRWNLNAVLPAIILAFLQRGPPRAERLAQIFDLQPQTRATFQEQCDLKMSIEF